LCISAARDNEIREIKEKLDQADARRKALEEEKVQKLEEHLQKVKQVRTADTESQYEQHKLDLDQKMKAVEQRRLDLENALKEKIQARQLLADQVRQRKKGRDKKNNEGTFCGCFSDGGTATDTLSSGVSFLSSFPFHLASCRPTGTRCFYHGIQCRGVKEIGAYDIIPSYQCGPGIYH